MTDYCVDDIIDNRFRITGVCSESGGMGKIYFVEDVKISHGFDLVLKLLLSEYTHCPDTVNRFRREVRILEKFRGNSRVVQILAANTECHTPYFVMKYHPEGDVSKLQSRIASDIPFQEKKFCDMIDAVNELHVEKVFHRDIKPANFLVSGDSVVVSDVGLAVHVDSNLTRCTSTTDCCGTYDFLPPEFLKGGFKSACAASDIFMLGKTFYALLTNGSPRYITRDGVDAGLWWVIERACEINISKRFQSLPEFKQALVQAYDILLKRNDGLQSCRAMLESINANAINNGQYESNKVEEFVNQACTLDTQDRNSLFLLLNCVFFSILAQRPFNRVRKAFLQKYAEMVEHGDYGWSFAETIANNVYQIFMSNDAADEEKAYGLDLAIHAAIAQNRFAAMNTCEQMIVSISEDSLAAEMVPVLHKYESSFLDGIELVRCTNDTIRQTLRKIRAD
ncbi:MAG: serine/threonine protein kinase [Thermoguttaceae bacterium]